MVREEINIPLVGSTIDRVRRYRNCMSGWHPSSVTVLDDNVNLFNWGQFSTTNRRPRSVTPSFNEIARRPSFRARTNASIPASDTRGKWVWYNPCSRKRYPSANRTVRMARLCTAKDLNIPSRAPPQVSIYSRCKALQRVPKSIYPSGPIWVHRLIVYKR